MIDDLEEVSREDKDLDSKGEPVSKPTEEKVSGIAVTQEKDILETSNRAKKEIRKEGKVHNLISSSRELKVATLKDT